jgi:hypothetical protein
MYKLEDAWIYKHFRLVTGWMSGRYGCSEMLEEILKYSELSVPALTMVRTIGKDGPNRVTFKQGLEAFSKETLTNIYDSLRTDDLPNLYDEPHEIIASIIDKLRIKHYPNIYPITLGLLPTTRQSIDLISTPDLTKWAECYGFTKEENPTSRYYDWERRGTTVKYIKQGQNSVLRELLLHKPKLGSLSVFIEALLDPTYDSDRTHIEIVPVEPIQNIQACISQISQVIPYTLTN